MNYRWIPIVIVFFILIGINTTEAVEEDGFDCVAKNFAGQIDKTLKWNGDVKFRYGRTRLYADRLTYNLETKIVVAVGNALYIKDESFISADTITYNRDTGKGLAYFGISYSEPWYGWGEKIYKMDENRYKIVNGYITTSDYLKPQWRIQSPEIMIYIGEKVVAKNAVIYFGNVPVMWFPKYVYSLREEYTPLNLILGRNGDWGAFLLVSYSWFFENVRPTLHLDYRENNKWAGGVDLHYQTPSDGSGALKTYFADDKYRELDDDSIVEESRYWISLRQNQPLGLSTYGSLEFHKLSDIDFRDDFFRDEADLEVQPESYLNVTHYNPNYTVNFFARPKINDFYNVLEKTPEISLNVRNQRIGDTSLYYSTKNSVSRLERDFADDSSETDYDSFRLDTLHKLSYPDKYFGWLNIIPRLNLRGTYYSDGVAEDNFSRGVVTGELEFFTKIFRLWDIEDPANNIHGLRHVVEPRLIYSYTPTPSKEPEELLQFDQIDRIDYSNRFKIDLRNKLQTKRYGGVWDLIDFDSFVFFYPDDNDEGNSFSDLFFDLELRPDRHFQIDADLEFDPYDQQIDVFNTQLTYYDKDLWSVNVEHRFLDNDSNLLASGFFCQLSPEWAFRLYGRYEFEDSDFEEAQIALIRDLNTWETSFTYRHREDEDQFWIMLYLKSYPNVPISAGN